MLLHHPAWSVCPIIIPAAASIVCFLNKKYSAWIAVATSLANGIVVSILVRQLLLFGIRRYSIGGWQTPLGIHLHPDGPAVLMLLMTGITGIGITLYAKGYFSFRFIPAEDIKAHIHQGQYFWPLWMMLLASLNGMFLSSDIFNIYVTMELAGIAAVSMAALAGHHSSLIAAFRYLLVNLTGSLCFLLGVVFLYQRYGILDLTLLAEMITAEPVVQTALALISLGLLFKAALFPLHFWLPPAHANAPAPVSAILSGLVIKGAFYLLFRLWFETFPVILTNGALVLLGTLGACAIVWGSLQAIRQQRLKLLVAYSTVSQLGYLFIAFPLISVGQNRETWSIVLFMVLAHACAKASMFMATGTIHLHTRQDRIDRLSGIRAYLPITSFAYAIAGVNLIGLPPSGGFIAKWLLLTSSFASSQWWWGLIVMAGSFLASIYVYRVVSRLFLIPDNVMINSSSHRSKLLEWPALILALIALLLGLAAQYPLLLLEAGDTMTYITPHGGLR